MSKVLTVAIAAYQAAATIRQTLDSLSCVKAMDLLDVLVVDDGSRDETAAIAQEYVDRYPASFRLCSKENGGWGSTVNKGIELAQGEYLFQLDSDDYVQNMDELLEYLESCDTDLVYAPYHSFRDSTGDICKAWTDPQGLPTRTPFPIEKAESIGSIHNIVFKTGLLRSNAIVITEHCFYTDVELTLKAYCYARTISYFDKPVYAYRLAFSGQSMSKAGIRKHYRDHLRVTEQLVDFRSEQPMSAHMYKLFSKRLAEMAYYSYLFFYALEATGEQRRELIAYDEMLKTKAPDIYQKTKGTLINALRALHFRGYRLIAHVKTNVDRLRRRNIYQAD